MIGRLASGATMVAGSIGGQHLQASEGRYSAMSLENAAELIRGNPARRITAAFSTPC
jgi:hypothetical protein